MAIEPVVEPDRGGEGLDKGVGGLGEAATPGFCGRCFVGHDRSGLSDCAQYIESAPGMRSHRRGMEARALDMNGVQAGSTAAGRPDRG